MSLFSKVIPIISIWGWSFGKPPVSFAVVFSPYERLERDVFQAPKALWASPAEEIGGKRHYCLYEGDFHFNPKKTELSKMDSFYVQGLRGEPLYWHPVLKETVDRAINEVMERMKKKVRNFERWFVWNGGNNPSHDTSLNLMSLSFVTTGPGCFAALSLGPLGLGIQAAVYGPIIQSTTRYFTRKHVLGCYPTLDSTLLELRRNVSFDLPTYKDLAKTLKSIPLKEPDIFDDTAVVCPSSITYFDLENFEPQPKLELAD